MESSCTVKIVDGLYLGDQITARDEEFLLLNHVALVINMTGKYLPNYYQHYDIAYSNVDWQEAGQRWSDLCDEIERVRVDGEVVLLHGGEHLEAPAALSSLYLMHKFRWSLFKTLEYMQSRIQGLSLSPESFQLLKKAEIDLLTEDTKLSYNWELRPTDSEELIVRNTFLNCSHTSNGLTKKPVNNKSTISLKSTRSVRTRRITWNLATSPADTGVTTLSSNYLKSNQTEANLRSRIMMSVRKIVTEGNKKQPPVRISRQNSSSHRQQQTTPTLKKQKSSYSFISLKSMRKDQNNRFTSPESSVHRQKEKETQKQKYSERMLTERLNTIEENLDVHEEPQKLKTQGESLSGKLVIDIRLPKRNEHFRSCKSLTLNNIKLKQNKSPKVPLRAPTPGKRK